MKQQKSRKGIRIVKRRTPKGRTSVRYVKERPSKAVCARCAAGLGGVPRAVPNELRKMTRSKRRVSRKFGGVLCAKCVREVEKYKTRLEEGYEIRRDLTIEKFLPEGWYKSLGVEAKKPGREKIASGKEEGDQVAEAEGKEPEKKGKKAEEKPKKKAKKKESKKEKKPETKPKKSSGKTKKATKSKKPEK